MAQNAGHSYQNQIYDALRKFNSLNEENGIDVTFSIKNTKLYLEVKGDSSSALDYGQAAIELSKGTGRWQFKKKDEFTSILDSVGILEFVSRHWQNNKHIYLKEEELRLRRSLGPQASAPIARTSARNARRDSTRQISYITSESGQAKLKIAGHAPEIIDVNLQSVGLDDNLLLNAIRKYYNLKGVNYIQIKNKGLFRISEKDPLEEISGGSLRVPLFKPLQSGFTARLKNYRKGQYDYTVALKIPGTLSLGVGYANVTRTIAGSPQKSQISVSLDNHEFINYLNELNQS
jgi:hypothetical protein